MKLNLDNRTCRNCGVDMPAQSLYCPKCSQKNTDGRIPIFAFIQDVFENILNFDSKLFKTSIGLFIPGRLTNQFFKGKHKSFAMPSRLFLMSAILFFTMMSLVVKYEMEGTNVDGDMFGVGSSISDKEEILLGINKLKENLNNEISPEFQLVLDSLENRAAEIESDSSTIDVIFWTGKKYVLDPVDFNKLSADSMIVKYEINDFIDKIIFTQGHKLYKDPRSLVSSLIGNLTWMMLLVIPTMALIFKLIYIRRTKYYVEHLVFLFHVHAFMLLIGTGMFVVYYFTDYNFEQTWWMTFVPLLYALIGLKVVYKQSWIKTILKMILIAISYFIVLLICFIIISTISFLLF